MTRRKISDGELREGKRAAALLKALAVGERALADSTRREFQSIGRRAEKLLRQLRALGAKERSK